MDSQFEHIIETCDALSEGPKLSQNPHYATDVHKTLRAHGWQNVGGTPGEQIYHHNKHSDDHIVANYKHPTDHTWAHKQGFKETPLQAGQGHESLHTHLTNFDDQHKSAMPTKVGFITNQGKWIGAKASLGHHTHEEVFDHPKHVKTLGGDNSTDALHNGHLRVVSGQAKGSAPHALSIEGRLNHENLGNAQKMFGKHKDAIKHVHWDETGDKHGKPGDEDIHRHGTHTVSSHQFFNASHPDHIRGIAKSITAQFHQKETTMSDKSFEEQMEEVIERVDDLAGLNEVHPYDPAKYDAMKKFKMSEPVSTSKSTPDALPKRMPKQSPDAAAHNLDIGHVATSHGWQHVNPGGNSAAYSHADHHGHVLRIKPNGHWLHKGGPNDNWEQGHGPEALHQHLSHFHSTQKESAPKQSIGPDHEVIGTIDKLGRVHEAGRCAGCGKFGATEPHDSEYAKSNFADKSSKLCKGCHDKDQARSTGAMTEVRIGKLKDVLPHEIGQQVKINNTVHNKFHGQKHGIGTVGTVTGYDQDHEGTPTYRIRHGNSKPVGMGHEYSEILAHHSDVEPIKESEDVTEGEVDHSQYIGSHGRSARGQGNWFIGINTKQIDFMNHKEGVHYVQHNGHFSDAVKKAKSVAPAGARLYAMP